LCIPGTNFVDVTHSWVKVTWLLKTHHLRPICLLMFAFSKHNILNQFVMKCLCPLNTIFWTFFTSKVNHSIERTHVTIHTHFSHKDLVSLLLPVLYQMTMTTGNGPFTIEILVGLGNIMNKVNLWKNTHYHSHFWQLCYWLMWSNFKMFLLAILNKI